mgnify:CR=1 FL=1
MQTTYKKELSNLKVIEKKQKDGSVNYLVTTLDGILSSGLHINQKRAEKTKQKIASHIAYKKNLLKYKTK